MRFLWILLTLASLGGLLYLGATQADLGGKKRKKRARLPSPVEVAPVESRAIELRRTYSGTLEATSRCTIVSMVPGRILRLLVDVADVVSRNQVVAHLEDAELQQEQRRAEANLAVALATEEQARQALEVAQRESKRVQVTHRRGVTSDSQLDEARIQLQSAAAAQKVATARVSSARAALETAKIRLGYTQVRATWEGSATHWVVARRFKDAGDTIEANGNLLALVQPSPLRAMISVTERDYALLRVGQPAELRADAFPGKVVPAKISRISPVFDAASRQAEVQLHVENRAGLLKPGMYARARVVLRRVARAQVIPFTALVRRGGVQGVFEVDAAGARVKWRPVEVGIRQDEQVQILRPRLGERVVTLGHQLIADSSQIVIPDAAE